MRIIAAELYATYKHDASSFERREELRLQLYHLQKMCSGILKIDFRPLYLSTIKANGANRAPYEDLLAEDLLAKVTNSQQAIPPGYHVTYGAAYQARSSILAYSLYICGISSAADFQSSTLGLKNSDGERIKSDRDIYEYLMGKMAVFVRIPNNTILQEVAQHFYYKLAVTTGGVINPDASYNVTDTVRKPLREFTMRDKIQSFEYYISQEVELMEKRKVTNKEKLLRILDVMCLYGMTSFRGQGLARRVKVHIPSETARKVKSPGGELRAKMPEHKKIEKAHIRHGSKKVKPNTVVKHNVIVYLSPHEVAKDFQINSLSGLKIPRKTPLNKAWTLEEVKIKNTNFDKVDTVGSGVDVVFTMKYNKLSGNKYIEMPALEWKEKIDFKEGNSKWHFQTDMYSHNPKSMTFFPWRNRYSEAYSFAKAKDKSSFNGNIKIYKRNMEPVGIHDIKDATSPAEMTKNVQQFLANNGGVMEITITDLPQILKREMKTIRERKIVFDIGFNKKVEAHFNQGLSLHPNGETNVFVTTSDNIGLARGHINTQPPEIVTKPREAYLSPGEVY